VIDVAVVVNALRALGGWAPEQEMAARRAA
jgi:hypothetical protein